MILCFSGRPRFFPGLPQLCCTSPLRVSSWQSTSLTPAAGTPKFEHPAPNSAPSTPNSAPSPHLLLACKLEVKLQHPAFQWIFRTDFLYDWLVWSPCSPRDSQESSPTPQFHSINSSVLSFLFLFCRRYVQLSHPYMTIGKTIILIRWTFVNKVMSLFFNMLSRLATAFLPRSEHLLIHGCSHCW